MVNGVPVSITQLSIQESAGQEGPDSVASVVIPTLAPLLWIDPSSLTGPLFSG